MTNSGMTSMNETAIPDAAPFLNFATVKAVIHKDMRTLWPLAAFVAVMNLLTAAFFREESDFPDFVIRYGDHSSVFHSAPLLFFASNLILLLGTALFIVLLAQQDRATDPRNDWMARPVKAGELVLAKVLTIIAVALVPVALGALISVLIGKQDAELAMLEVYSAALAGALFLTIGWLCSGPIQALLSAVGLLILTIVLAFVTVRAFEFTAQPLPARTALIEQPQAAPVARPAPAPPTASSGRGPATAQIEQPSGPGRVTVSAGNPVQEFAIAAGLFVAVIAGLSVPLWLLLGRRQVLAARLTFLALYSVALFLFIREVRVVDEVAEVAPPATLVQRMAAFRKHDANGDLKLDKAEYDKVLNDLGFPGQLDNFWPQRDLNNDGFIDAEEMRPAIGAAPGIPPPPATLDQRMKAFSGNDANDDGKLTKEEYAGALKALGFADQLESFWTQRDADKDGFISLEEYLPAIQAQPIQELPAVQDPSVQNRDGPTR
jgi:hypothetical protein